MTDGKSRTLKDTCIWMFMYCHHSNGCGLTVQQGDNTAQYSVCWFEAGVDADAIKRSYNLHDATEYGAEALAVLIAIERTEYNIVERSITSTGIDYWLGFRDGEPNQPFRRAGRLEITGMIETPTNTIAARLAGKNRQTIRSDYMTFPVYVIVIEFGRPHAVMATRYANS